MSSKAKRNAVVVAIAAIVTVLSAPIGGVAGPVVAKIGAAVVGAGSAYAAYVGSFIVRAALGLAAMAMASGVGRVPPRGYKVTQKGSALDRQVVYGETKAAGVVVFDGTTGSSNKYLHRVIAFTGHEIQEFKEVWLDNYKLTVNLSTGAVTSAVQLKADTDSSSATYRQMIPDTSTTTNRYNSYVRIKGHLGTTTQTADSDLVSEVSEWTSAHQLKGISYLYIRLEYNQDTFPNGVPEIQATIKGKKVYDPRSSSTAWSDNPALCIRDYLINSDYGLGETSSYIDDTLVTTAANYCDTTATDSSKFFTLNGAFTTGSQPVDVLAELLTTMNGLLWYGQGKWRMRAAKWTAPTLTLDENDLRASLNIATRHSGRDNFNVIKGTWRGADSNWQTTDFPEYKVAQAITDDGGFENTMSLDLGFTTSVNEAQRIARITYERNREQLTVSSTFGLNALKCQVGDFIQLNYDRMGWSNSTPKYWEVTEWSFGFSELLPMVKLTLREISSTVFDEISNYEVYEKNNTSFASPFDAQTISSLSAVATSSLALDGTVIPKLKFTWSVSDASDVDYYIFGYRTTSSGSYNEVQLNDSQYEIEPAVAGQTYYYSVKAINLLGVAGAASTGNVAAVGDTTAPTAPSAPTVSAGLRQLEISWPSYTLPDDFATMEIHSSTSNSFTADLPTDITTSTTYLGRTNGTSFVHAGLTSNSTHYYRLRAVDLSGNASSVSAIGSGTTVADTDVGEEHAAQLATLVWDDLEQGYEGLNNHGEWKIWTQSGSSIGLGASLNPSGERDWSSSINRLALYATDKNGDDQTRYLQTLEVGDFVTVVSNEGNPVHTRVFKISAVYTPTDVNVSTIWVFAGTTTLVTGNTGLFTDSGNNDVEFRFSRVDPFSIPTVRSGVKIPTDNDPTTNTATMVSGTPSGTVGGGTANLTRAFLDANPQISDMSQITDKTRIWAQFFLNSQPDNSTYYSYRLWQPLSQTWSNHSTVLSEDIAFIDTLIADSAIISRAGILELDVDQININSSVKLDNGAAWRVGDKQSPAETTKNGLFFGDPISLDEEFSFATTGGVTLDSNNDPVMTNSHGVLFNKDVTKLTNPTIEIGDTVMASEVTQSGPDPTSINHSVTSQRTNTGSVTIANTAVKLYIHGVAGGGGGSGAQGTNTTSNRAGVDTTYSLKHGSTVLSTVTASGGAAGTGTGVAKTDGDAGQNSAYANGGAGGGANTNGGNGSLGSGAGGGGGRDWTFFGSSSLKGGAGGSAGVNFTRTLDVTALKLANSISSNDTLTLEYSVGTGGNYSGSVNYGDGGYGGAGFLKYTVESAGLETVHLNSIRTWSTTSRQIGATVYSNGSNERMVSISLVGNNSPANTTFAAIIRATGASGSYQEIAKMYTTADDDAANMTFIVPANYDYRVYQQSGANSGYTYEWWEYV